MVSIFEVNFLGPDGDIAALYVDGPSKDGVQLDALPYLRLRPSAFESEDWVFVENHEDDNGTGHFNEGWMPAWAIGDPIPSPPQVISSKAVTFGAVRNEIDVSGTIGIKIAAEYLIALFLIENQVDLSQDPAEDDYPVNNPIPDPDAKGPFCVTTAQWDAFLAVEGARLSWSGPFLKELALPQMRCAAWHTRQNWKAMGVSLGGSADDPYVARFLDLFLAHLIGAKAAAEVIKLERDGSGLSKFIKTIVRDSNSWSDTAPELVALFKNRASYLGPLKTTGGTVGGLTRISTFLDTCRDVLAPALAYARELVNLHLPGFAIEYSDRMAAAFGEADQEFGDWQQDGGWTEQTDPGFTRAKEYFEATDFPNGSIAIGADGELTHWCGAFVAACIKKAGGKPPAGAAAAANWRKWGDASLPAKDGSNVPQGAVVMTAGNQGTSRISHVNFFVEWAGDGVHYIGLGGNQSDAVTRAPFKIENIADIRVLAGKTTADVSGSDEDIMARTLYGEISTVATSEDQIKNVADVILNRFINGYRSDGSIAGTCLKHKQFSCWNPGTSARRRLEALPGSDQAGYDKALAFAQQYIAERLADPEAPQPLEGAHHYHNHDVNPDWVVPANMVVNDGLHKFYKDIA